MTQSGQFLAGLSQEAERIGLDDVVRRALCDEIASHLDAAIQARMELGSTFEEAEQGAVAALGHPRKLVRGIREVQAEKVAPDRVVQALPFVLSLMVFPPMIVEFPRLYVSLFPLFMAIPAGVVVWRTAIGRGRQILPMLKACALSAVLTGICLTAYFTPTRSGAPARVSRLEAGAFVELGHRVREALDHPVRQVAGGWEAATVVDIRSGRPLSSNEFYEVDWKRRGIGYRQFASQAEASQSYDKEFVEGPAGEWARGIATQSTDIERASSVSLGSLGIFLLSGGCWNGLFLAAGLLLHLPTAWIRDAVKRRRPTRLAR